LSSTSSEQGVDEWLNHNTKSVLVFKVVVARQTDSDGEATIVKHLE
jgi:hypothetical protein